MPSSVLHSGKVDHRVSGEYADEGGQLDSDTEEYGKEFDRYLARSSIFQKIWRGGPEHVKIRLRRQMAFDDKGRLLYNEKPYNRDSWCCYYVGDCEHYGPPKPIRQMGRMANEQPNPYNTHPEIEVRTRDGDILILDACPCGGSLQMDNQGELYCTECYEIHARAKPERKNPRMRLNILE